MQFVNVTLQYIFFVAKKRATFIEQILSVTTGHFVVVLPNFDEKQLM